MISIRKVIKFGKKSLAVTIPPDWWTRNDEPQHVEVDDKGDTITISPVPERKDK